MYKKERDVTPDLAEHFQKTFFREERSKIVVIVAVNCFLATLLRLCARCTGFPSV